MVREISVLTHVGKPDGSNIKMRGSKRGRNINGDMTVVAPTLKSFQCTRSPIGLENGAGFEAAMRHPFRNAHCGTLCI